MSTTKNCRISDYRDWWSNWDCYIDLFHVTSWYLIKECERPSDWSCCSTCSRTRWHFSFWSEGKSSETWCDSTDIYCLIFTVTFCEDKVITQSRTDPGLEPALDLNLDLDLTGLNRSLWVLETTFIFHLFVVLNTHTSLITCLSSWLQKLSEPSTHITFLTFYWFMTPLALSDPQILRPSDPFFLLV